MAYYLEIDGDRRALAGMAVAGCRLSLRANGFDELAFERDAAADEALIPHGSPVSLWTEALGGDCLFAGEVAAARILGDTGTGVVHSYACRNPLARLEAIQYVQPSAAWDADGGLAPATFQDARVVLGMSGSTRRTAGEQIADILGYARGLCGLPIEIDPSVSAAGSEFPLDQRENVSCWEAIVCCLRWMSGHTLWVDYPDGVPTVMLTPYSGLRDVSMAVAGGAVRSLAATPRHDLVRRGVNIHYRKTASVDGATREQRYVRSAGQSSAPDALNLYIDLEGSSRQTVSQAVTAAAYPSFAASGYSSAETRAWVLAKVPWIADLASWTITGISRSGSRSYPRELLAGQVADWMHEGIETEFVTVDISYEIRRDGALLEEASVSVPIECASTSATTKTYRRTVSYDSGESVPVGLETAILSAWSVLHWDGNLSTDIGRADWIRPGCRLSLTGTAGSLAEMGAVVQSCDADLATGELDVSFGTCRGLEADSLVALYRACRGRRHAWSLRAADPSRDDGTSVSGGHYNNAAPSPAMSRAAERIAGADAAGRTHVIDLRPCAVAFATASDAAPQSVQLREVAVVVQEGGNAVAKKAQVLCGAAYGPAIPVGGGAPSNPSSATTLGSTDEGSESSNQSAWTAGGAAGLKLYVLTRVVYNENGGKTLYGFKRLLTFDSQGRLYSAGVESRYEIAAAVEATFSL